MRAQDGSEKSTDVFTPEKRSQVMSRVRSKNTKPEVFVRSVLHEMGYRFRIHRKDLPGKPDVVLPKRCVIFFVHGCFWHQHPGCKRATIPQQNSDYWGPKLRRNVERDLEARRLLKEQGWKVHVLWECELPRGREDLKKVLAEVLTESS